jgi:hypothetical protein
MSTDATTKAARALEEARCELQTLSRTAESEIESVARTFESLTGPIDTILGLAAEIIACVENESVGAVIPKVQTLGAEAKRFIAERLRATDTILETVTREVQLLHQLSHVTRSQAAIALETKALSVLTNIEVARLGAVGVGFQYLARELAEFSKSVSADTQELAGHAEGRCATIEETRRVLAAEVPRLREELPRIEDDLGNALSVVDANLTQLSQMPAQFRGCVKDVAQQVAGVVAAVQAHDITHQQIDHVREGLTLIAGEIFSRQDAEGDFAPGLARAWAGLSIQIYQLQSIRGTIASWASQIRACTGGILQVSASDVAGIGTRVLGQERELSSQFARVERLERESEAHGERILHTFGGLSNLTQLVTEHLQRSRSVRDHLQLLTFNSIIEASGLGTRAAAILAIAQSIKGISTEWSQITERSGNAMKEVLDLEKCANEAMGAFSQASSGRLREAQGQTTSGLDNLRAAAAFASDRAQAMSDATEAMRAKISSVAESIDLFEGCLGRIDAMLAEMEGLRRQLEIDHPEAKKGFDEVEVERLFSTSYTTEMERDVLRAALRGTELPAAQASIAGNSVELF